MKTRAYAYAAIRRDAHHEIDGEEFIDLKTISYNANITISLAQEARNELYNDDYPIIRITEVLIEEKEKS